MEFQIKEPCDASWDKMSETNNGRHCSLCAKDVIDFSTWEVQDIIAYLNKNQNTCGRVQKIKIQPQQNITNVYNNILHWAKPLTNKIAAIFLVTFCWSLQSCSNNNDSTITKNSNDTVISKIPISHQDSNSTLDDSNMIVGEFLPYTDSIETIQDAIPLIPIPNPKKVLDNVIGCQVEEFEQGKMVIVPNPNEISIN